MAQSLNIQTPESILDPVLQQNLLEHRAALLARRHIEDTEQGIDTSHSVYQMAMAHADLTYWREMQNQKQDAPKEHEGTIASLRNLVGY